MRSRPRAALAGALALPVLLTACGSVSSAAASLEGDAAEAAAHLAGARGVGLSLRFDDPDGALARALQDGPDGMPAALAEAVVGSRIDLQVAATDGRTLSQQPDEDLALAEQLRWYDSSFSVSTPEGAVLSSRTVDGAAYVTSDLDELERVAAAAGTPVSLAELVAGGPAPLEQAHTDLRAGQWLRLPVTDLLEQVGEPADQPFAGGLPDGLLDDLQDAVEPHTRLRDLGSDGGVRRVTVEVEVKALLEAVTRTVQSSLPDDEAAAAALPADLLDGLSDEPLTGTLTLQDGHYRSLEVPLAGLVDLVEDPGADVPDLGDAELVIGVDDAVDAVAAPAEVSDVDLLSVLGQALGEASQTEEGVPAPEVELGPDDELPLVEEELTSEDEALLECYAQAETEEQLAACDATA